MAKTQEGPEKKYWLDEPSNIDKVVYGLYGLCAVLFVIDYFVPKHGPFAVEYVLGFYGIFGFVACVALVLAAKQMRKVLKRREDYYDR